MNLEEKVFDKVNRASCQYYTFENADNKKWSISSDCLKTGFEIYEPSSIKGTLLKKFSYLLRFSIVRKILKVQAEKTSLCEFVFNSIHSVFGERTYYSIFYGTPSTDQKITIQIFNKEEILGYCKVGESTRVQSLFVKEVQMLEYLESKGMKNVPKALFQDRKDSLSVFIQSTEKKRSSIVLHNFTHEHLLFLNKLYECTKRKLYFEETDFYKLLNTIVENKELLTEKENILIKTALDVLYNKYYNKEVEWGVVHGDFTPWNTCLVDNGLFAFDFEYSLYNAPKEIDVWHFYIQKDLYEKKKSVGAAASSILSILHKEDLDIVSLYSYFLFYVAIYLLRGQEDDIKMIKTRIEILSLVVQKLNGETHDEH